MVWLICTICWSICLGIHFCQAISGYYQKDGDFKYFVIMCVLDVLCIIVMAQNVIANI